MDELSKEDLEQLLGVFRHQSASILEEMIEDLLALESGRRDPDVMTRLRRGAHTIKGDSACVGFEGFAQVAHKIEDVLDTMLSEECRFEKPMFDAMLESLDGLRLAITREKVADLSASAMRELLSGLDFPTSDFSSLVSKKRSKKHAAIGAVTQKPAAAFESAKRARHEFVRVEASKLDELLNLAGEMVIARSTINQAAPAIEQILSTHELGSRFNAAHGQMGKLIAELQKNVLKMRMVTIDTVFRRFARPMRELANEQRKEVELIYKGGDTELDRALVDLLYEPLLHLLRNAVDHGLEVTDERKTSGKPEVGAITLRAYHEGNQVVVEVEDDGRGLDPGALKRRALEVGLISEVEAEQMDEEDALELIFREGFSTAKKLTPLSGRGIGASAARSVIEQLRGGVTVRSEVGKGTTFILRMPLTLAIIRALLFKVGGRLFALPLLAVSEIVRAMPEDISTIDGSEVYRLRNRFISVVRPGEVLGFEWQKGGAGEHFSEGLGHIFIIVLAVGLKRYGLIADELLGEQELVIKPLESNWISNDVLAGASVLGDGRVVLIMDAEMTFRRAVKHERAKVNARENYAV